jgi:hypothetical protein
LSAVALGGFAGGALLLAAIGLYGVLAFVVGSAHFRGRARPAGRGIALRLPCPRGERRRSTRW